MSSSSITLDAQDIHKSFYHPSKVDILKGVSLQVHKGQSVAIMGASGEGKSTLLHILGSLEKPCSGSLSIAGKKVKGSGRSKIRNKHVGFVFQGFNLLEDYSCLENVLMPLRIARKSTSKDGEHVRHALSLIDKVGLSQRCHFDAKLLSGGEKQRVAIARALCNDPDLLLADEPSGNLDHQTSQNIHKLLLSSAKENEKALIIVTHDEELANLCDTCYSLKDGVLCTA